MCRPRGREMMSRSTMICTIPQPREVFSAATVSCEGARPLDGVRLRQPVPTSYYYVVQAETPSQIIHETAAIWQKGTPKALLGSNYRQGVALYTAIAALQL